MVSEINHSNRRLNIIISGWLCIAIGSGIVFSDASPFAISIAAPMSMGGALLLIYGLSIGNREGYSDEHDEPWTPPISRMPDAGRPMYRVDTTLEEPIVTSILCGRCANLEWLEGAKPGSFSCPSCGTELWSTEEE